MTLERIGPARPYVESEKQREVCRKALQRLCDGIILRSWVEYDMAYNWPKISYLTAKSLGLLVALGCASVHEAHRNMLIEYEERGGLSAEEYRAIVDVTSHPREEEWRPLN
jgi:hypothetical protein